MLLDRRTCFVLRLTALSRQEHPLLLVKTAAVLELLDFSDYRVDYSTIDAEEQSGPNQLNSCTTSRNLKQHPTCLVPACPG